MAPPVRHHTITEYGCIAPSATEVDSGDVLYIREHDYHHLEDFVLRNCDDAASKGHEFFSLTYKKGVGLCLQARNYVGVIQTDSGLVIEILPKIHRESTGELMDYPDTRRLFLQMLRTVKDTPFKLFNESDIATYRMHIMEIFIHLFICQMNELVRQGIRSGYVTMEDNSKFLKGKLRINDHIKKNIIHRERFYIEFDEFVRDRPENRLIKSTLSLLLNASGSNDNIKKLRELLFIFDDVNESDDIKGDFSRCINNRMMKHYDTVLKWCRVFLRGESFTNWKGNGRVNAILFPMNVVFESFVTSCLRQSGIFNDLKAQDSTYHLANRIAGNDKSEKMFRIKPDITGSTEDCFYIMDAKWKLIKEKDRENNWYISQGDMYQLLSYATVYSAANKKRSTRLLLIYPKTNDFREPIEFVYNDNNNTRLTLWPFDIEKAVTNGEYCREWINSMKEHFQS